MVDPEVQAADGEGATAGPLPGVGGDEVGDGPAPVSGMPGDDGDPARVAHRGPGAAVRGGDRHRAGPSARPEGLAGGDEGDLAGLARAVLVELHVEEVGADPGVT